MDEIGVGDDLLPNTAAAETVGTSEVRGDPSSEQTSVLRVAIVNTTEESVELRLTRLRLRDGTTLRASPVPAPSPPARRGS